MCPPVLLFSIGIGFRLAKDAYQDNEAHAEMNPRKQCRFDCVWGLVVAFFYDCSSTCPACLVLKDRRTEDMYELLAPGILIQHLWPHLLVIGALVALVALGDQTRNRLRLAIALPGLFFVLVIIYWVTENFIHVGDGLGCAISCIVFLGLMGGGLYLTHRANCPRWAQVAAGIVGGIFGTGLTPNAFHLARDCVPIQR